MQPCRIDGRDGLNVQRYRKRNVRIAVNKVQVFLELTFDPDPTAPNDFLEDDIVWWRGMEEDGRWVDEDVFFYVQCGVRDSSRRSILCPIRILGDKILTDGDAIDETSGQKLPKDLELPNHIMTCQHSTYDEQQVYVPASRWVGVEMPRSWL